MKSKNFIIILICIAVAGLSIWVVMLAVTWGDKDPNALLIGMGKTGVSLSLISVVGGLVQWILKSREAERQRELEKRNFYKNVLSDLKTVYDKVERARLLIEAHRTAKTYGEEMRALIDGVVILHIIKRAFNPEFPILAEKLEPCLKAMNGFIKNLLNEYRDNYKRISVLQELDEAKKEQLKAAKLKNKNTEIKENEVPYSAWKQMKNLTCLRVLIDDDFFGTYESEFLEHLDEASKILRGRIPVEE